VTWPARGGNRLAAYLCNRSKIDLDPQGRVLSWTQVLTEDNFDRVSAGLTRGDLLLALGRPSERRPGGWPRGEVWSYRYAAWTCQWFQVSLDDAGVVTSSAYGIDPHCDANVGERSLITR